MLTNSTGTDGSYLALGNSGLAVLEGEAQGIRTLSPTKDPCNRLGSHQAPLTRPREKEEIELNLHKNDNIKENWHKNREKERKARR